MAQKKRLQESYLPGIIMLLILAVVAGMAIYQGVQYRKTVKLLTSIDPQQISIFRIYPGVIRSVGTPREFRSPDPMIDEFFHSLTDLHSYQPNHDTVASRDHSWFLEVTTGDTMIQIAFHIPSHLDDIVAGQLGKFRENHVSIYGSFQSWKLYQWYQKYSHRWLEPSSK